MQVACLEIRIKYHLFKHILLLKVETMNNKYIITTFPIPNRL